MWLRKRKLLCGQPRRDGSGETCGRWLATLEGMDLVFKCPRCRQVHRVPLGEIVAWVSEEAERAAGFLESRKGKHEQVD